MDMRPTARQQELIDLAAKLAREKFEPRAAELDRDARFPFEDYDDLREAGLLALCVPEAYGGLGGDLETYVLVVEQLAKGNASTALTYNMHCLTMLMMGEMATLTKWMKATGAPQHRAAHFKEVVEWRLRPTTVNPSSRGKRIRRFRSVAGAGTRAEKSTAGIGLMVKFFVSLSIPQITSRHRDPDRRCTVDRTHAVPKSAARSGRRDVFGRMGSDRHAGDNEPQYGIGRRFRAR